VSERGQLEDPWAAWLLERRHGGDEDHHHAVWLPMLLGIRDRVLEHARVREGDTLLDVGAGEGLIGFGALPMVGPAGRVIFSDISPALLDRCRELASELGAMDRCWFVLNGAEDLTEVGTGSVDVVSTRSVLIYVKDKRRAFSEFFRVLRPGGRLSIFEPINRLMYPEPLGRYAGFDVGAVAELAERVKAVAMRRSPGCDPMIDFDERDLFDMAETAGFVDVHLELRRSRTSECRPARWDAWLRSSPNPLAPTRGEAIDEALAPRERGRFLAHLKPLVQRGDQLSHEVLANLWASIPLS
jgi:arsenite methyltransferase